MTLDLQEYLTARSAADKDRKIAELTNWLLSDYVLRLNHINRCKYLGIPPDETEYHLQKTAYTVEQALRALQGKPALEEIKTIDILGEE